MTPARRLLIWGVVGLLTLTPIVLSAFSPLLAWRLPVYILAGFAGIAGLSMMLIQPLLARRLLPGLSPARSLRLHQSFGMALTALVVAHVAGLWITSPPDVVDVLLFRSPTPFSVWGVLAMWVVFAAALLAVFRRRLRLSRSHWLMAHKALVAVAVIGTAVHALLIEGTMEQVSKIAICAAVLGATCFAIFRPRR